MHEKVQNDNEDSSDCQMLLCAEFQAFYGKKKPRPLPVTPYVAFLLNLFVQTNKMVNFKCGIEIRKR